ncbi:hypothetical protein [Actinoplanes sp. N902-109]|uniref:hypothetical protein n=1 Tax=Actinoplanes sp. (strain N902-109) TaxID=649831 RepID=UPI0003294A91|nr:hypothetical protein [Actinoplanes sp. N902-109]AGL19070.1 hypothetical protein L083_5560 [Actinoplanes sp. N902-109]
MLHPRPDADPDADADAETATLPLAAPVSLEYSGDAPDGPFGRGWRLCLPDPAAATAQRVPGHAAPARISYAGPVALTMEFEYEHHHSPAALRCRSVRVTRQTGADTAPVRQEYRFDYRSLADSGAVLERVRVFPVDDAPAVATCARAGRQWRIALGARVVLVPHSVGMFHLAVLLANANVEIDAAELVAGVGRLVARPTPVAQPILDDAAIRRYRARLAQLTAEIELCAAEDRPVPPDARVERDWLLAELGAGTGRGGAARSFADNGERARIAVGKAIRRAITRIGAADQIVGEHLRRSISTGMRCAYLA